MPESFRFDRFELRSSERVLLVAGTPVGLGSRTFDLLWCLVTRNERIVSKNELLEQVWPGQVVEENNLSVHVSALRKILGTGAIATVSGRGYRFTLPLVAAGTGVAAAARMVSPEAPQRPTIAVLPLRVLCDDSAATFFAQGLVEDVTALLARVPGFLVIAHESTTGLRDPQVPLDEVAGQLGVRFLVQGSVRPRASALRISLRLIEAATARILWTGQFDSPAAEFGEAQESFARGIISELEPELTQAEIAHIRRQRPDDPDAWAHYHRAVGALGATGWSSEGLATARAELLRSTTRDPSFALGRSHYALLTILAANIGMAPDTPALRADVLAAANESIDMDNGSSEVLGYAGCALCDLGDFTRGLDILQRALELNPSNAQAHVAMGAALALNGKVGEGVQRLRHGMRISPRDRRLGFWGWLLGCFLLRADCVDEAMVEAALACRNDPRFHLAHVLQAALFDRSGATDDAIAALTVARQRRRQLSLDEVTLTHGRRIGGRLALLWDRTG